MRWVIRGTTLVAGSGIAVGACFIFSAPLWITIGLPVLVGVGIVAGWIIKDLTGKPKTKTRIY